MTMIAIELATGSKHTVDDEYPNLVARLNHARAENRTVKVKLWGMTGPASEIEINPAYVTSIQPFPVS